MVLEFNVVNKCQEVGAGDKMSHDAHWVVSQLRKSTKVKATNRPTSKHGYLGHCGGYDAQTTR